MIPSMLTALVTAGLVTAETAKSADSPAESGTFAGTQFIALFQLLSKGRGDQVCCAGLIVDDKIRLHSAASGRTLLGFARTAALCRVDDSRSKRFLDRQGNFRVFMGGLVWIRGDKSRTAFHDFGLARWRKASRKFVGLAANEFAPQCMIGCAEE